MTETERSPEYRILRFLNDRFEEYKITDGVMHIVFHDIPKDQYDQIIEKLREKNYIRNKPDSDKPNGLSIFPPNGYRRLEQLEEKIRKEKRKELLASIQSLRTWVAIATIAATIAAFAQVHYASRQTWYQSESLRLDSIQRNKTQAESQTFRIDSVHDTVYIEKKIDSVK